MSDCDVSAGGNFTDEDYVNHLNGKLEEKVISLESDNALLTAKVKELEGNLQLTESLLGDSEHSYYLSTLTTNRGKE